MRLFSILESVKPAPDATPEFIREMQDVRGVRVVRLRGPVGKEIGAQFQAQTTAASARAAFSMPLLLDFKDTTGCDSATLAYLVQALRDRMVAHAQVGIINAPPQLIADLGIARIEGLFRVFESEAQAMEAFASPPSPPAGAGRNA